MKHILRCAAILAVLALGFSLASCKNDTDDDEPTSDGTEKQVGSISYATASVSKTTDSTAFTNTLTKTGDGTVSYASDKAAVATVNATTGEVTIKGAGTATITATVADSDTYTYATKTATYTLTITQAYIGTKAPSEAKAVGDIVFSDGSATAYTSELTSEQKSKAVAVIFYAGSASDTLGAKTLGVGLKNTRGETTTTLAWAPDNTTGYTTNFTDIQCTQSMTAPTDGTAYYSYTYSGMTYYVTGDFDGSNNWAKVCVADSTASENAATNYPAFNWLNTYAATNSLTGDMAIGWYLPSVVELLIMCGDKAKVNAALEAVGGTKIADNSYWSSSQYSSKSNYACSVWFNDGTLFNDIKKYDGSVCAVRAF